MWKTTYHNGSLLDVKGCGHTTSSLGPSGATRCEKSIPTDVKTHFYSRVCWNISEKLEENKKVEN